MNTYILAVETSTPVCDVALIVNSDDGIKVFNESYSASTEHAEHLFPMVNRLLDQANIKRNHLNAVAFGQGPGGFTGLRVACGVAQGVAYGLGLPVIPVSSLLTVAWQAHGELQNSAHINGNAVHVVLQDARMSEVYLAVYSARQHGKNQEWYTLQEPVLVASEQVADWVKHTMSQWLVSPDNPLWVSGNAIKAYNLEAELKNSSIQIAGVWHPTAVALANIALTDWQNGKTISPEQAMPLYVRDKVAFTISERKQGAGGNPKANNIKL